MVAILLAGGVFLPASLLAQAARTTHQFEYYLPFYQFMDGTPLMWAYSGSRTAESNGTGLRYTLGIKERHLFSYSGSRFHASYYKRGHVPPGEIDFRFFKLRTLDYHYRWLNRSRLHVDAFVGITKRWGNELFVVSYPQWWEIMLHSYTTRDWGMHLGMRAEYTFWKRFYCSLQFSYTGYFARPEWEPRPSVIKTGPNMNVLALDVGIGYSLPKINFKKKPGQRRIEF